MHLKQYQIQRNRTKAKAENQIRIGDDYSIPEGKPDVAQILQKKSEISVEEVHTEKGKIRVRGFLKIWVLYLAQRSEEPVGSLKIELPFEEILYMEEVAHGDNLKIGWNIEEVQVTVIHPGRLGVSAHVTLFGEVTAREELSLTEGLEETSQVFAKTENFTMAEPVLHQTENYLIKDEVVLPANQPNVHNLLWKDLQLRGMETRIQEGRLAVKGEVLFFVMYQGDEERQDIQWLEQSIPFHGIVELPQITSEMFGTLGTEVVKQSIEVQPDYDGELRTFRLEMLLELQLCVYREKVCKKLTDAYGLRQELQLQEEAVSLERLRMCNEIKCRVSGRKSVNAENRSLQILGHQARLHQKHITITDQGILWEAILAVQVLYLKEDGYKNFGCDEVLIPCKQMIDIPGIEKTDLWQIRELPEQIFIGTPENGQIEVRGIIALNACVMETFSVHNVKEILTGEYDLEAYKKSPGMKVHFVQHGEDLWTVAKENRVSIEDVKKRNELETDEIVPGQKLFFLKPGIDLISD